MKSSLRLLFALFMLGAGIEAQAQLSGTISVPSATYPTLKAVVDSLNSQGVGPGGVLIDLVAGNPQTAPAGGYRLGSTVLNASTSATKTIVFKGNGNLITAGTGTGTGTAFDAIFAIAGTDYVTVDSLNLIDLNTASATTQMEAGYALINLNASAPFDGAQNNTIKSCTITLNKANSNGSNGILVRHFAGTAATDLVITAAADLHSNNKFYSNSISNVGSGIYIYGYNAASPYALYDQNNDIGGTSAATGNSITNFGGLTALQINGVYALYQNNVNISYNTMNNLTNGVASTSALVGVFVNGTNQNMVVSNNNIALAIANSSTTATLAAGIYTNGAGGNITASNNNISLTATGANASSLYGMSLGPSVSINNITATNNDVTLNQSTLAASYGILGNGLAATNISNNVFQATTPVATTGAMYFVYMTATATSEVVANNKFNNVTITTTGAVYLIYTSNACTNTTITGNGITTQFTKNGASGSFYGIYNFGSPASGTSTVTGNNFSNINLTTSSASAGIYYATVATHTHVIANDTVTNITNTGAADLRGIYFGYGLLNTVNNNVVRNIANAGVTYGMYAGNTSTVTSNIYGNTLAGIISTGASTACYGMYCPAAATTADNIYQNNISGIAANGASGTVYGLYVNNGGVSNIYNNFISGLNTPASSGTSPVYGLYLAAGANNNLYFNTINLNPSSTGANFGATGIYYPNNAASVLDLRNNIVRVLATPSGSGTVVALRRASGTAGVAPVNYANSSSANIYYVPTATNAYLYYESASTTAVNGFNITNDPSFNTACALYKRFMAGRDVSSYTENNLVQIGTTVTFAPVGASYAESNAAATSPSITTDYNGVTRATPADIGALQFAGTAYADVAAPSIVYTSLPVSTYCLNPPTLTATISDASGVNTTAGLKPRLYYKKSVETNAFNGGNTSGTNGWKFVEGTNVGSTFTFNIDYALLNTPIAVGDSITYFVVAQDLAATPNVGASIIGFASGYCPATVNLLAAAGPTANTPLPNGYKILPIPTFAATASPGNLCVSGASTISLNLTVPAGTSVQWQQDNGTGTFVNIAGATGSTYTTPTISATNNYRAQFICNGAPVATSAPALVSVNNPAVLTTAPATRCGVGTLSLGATAATGSTIKWYTAATGGSPVATGSPFVTPPLSATTTYYVSASEVSSSETIPSPAATTSTFFSAAVGWGIRFTANASATITSVDIKASNTTAGPASMQILITDLADVVVYSGTVYNFNITTSLAVYTVPVNITVAPGNYKMVMTSTGISALVRESSGVSFPYTAPSNAITLTAGANGVGTAQTTTAYYWFYNWIIAPGCEGTRTAVVATVTPPPALMATSPQAPGVCSGTAVTLNANSTNTGYAYSWSTGQSTQSFTLTPTATTTYTVTATDAGTGCVAKDSVTVAVNPQPVAPVLTPSAASICAGSSVQLTAALTGVPPGGVLLSEDFESGTLGTFTASFGPQNTGLPAAAWTNYTNGSVLAGVANSTTFGTKYVASNADAGGSSANPGIQHTYLTSAPMSTLGFTNLTLSFRQFWSYYNLGSPLDQGLVEVSTNGTTWTTVLTNPASNVGTATAFALTTVPLNAYVNVPSLQFRFSYLSNWGYSWAVDSIRVYGVGAQAGVNNWSPVAGLYKDVALTQPVLATDTNRVVFASPAATTTYTSKANVQGCYSAVSNNAVVTVNPAPSSVITYTGPTTFCEGANLVLNAPTGTGLTYVWNRNGTPIVPAVTTQSYTATTSGAYTVTVTNATPCSSTTTTPVTVTVNPAPATTITANGSTIFCTGSVQLCAPAPPTGTVYTYVWKNNNVAIVPAQTAQCYTISTSGNITVTVTNTTTGCSATTPTATVVSAGAAPTAVITAAGSATICQNQTVRLRTNNAPGLSYQWALGGVAIPGAIDSFYLAGTPGNYTVTVSIAAAPTCQSLSAPFAVTVNPLPNAALTASGAPTTFCQGGTVVLTATPAGLSYQWPAPGSGTAQTFTANASGSYTAVVTNPATGCFATTNPVAVTVNPLPTATITAAGATAICAGNSVVLNANTGAGLTYQWANGGGVIAGATTASYTATAAGAYTVKVTNANGCSATSAVTNVTVNPLPPTTVTPSGSVSICAGSSIVLSGPSSPTGMTYQWRNGAANATGAATASAYTANAAGAYRLVITTAAGCRDSSGVTNVSVLPLPTVSMSPTAATTACDSVVLTTSTTGVTYQWNYNNNPIIGATGSQYAATVSGNYSLTNTSTANGCSATTTNVAVTINQSPAASITYGSPLNFCTGGAVVLNTYTGANLTYEWRENNATIAGAISNTYVTTTTGLYTVKVVNTLTGCVGVSQVVNVRVNPLPNPVVTYTSASNTLSTTQPYAAYQWLLNNQTIGGATQRNYNPRENGAYMVFVTDTNGCVNQSSIFFLNTLGVANTATGKAIRIYPNPTTGVLHVQSPMAVTLALRDVTGKTVAVGTDKEPLQLQRLADGIYLLYIKDESGQLVRAEKIVKTTN